MSILIIGGAVLFFCIVVILSLRRIVPTNQAHIVRTGKTTKCYGDGIVNSSGNTYYQFPQWVPYLGVTVTKMSTKIFDIDLFTYEAYDKDKTPFVVDIKAFFRVDNPLLAAQRISNQDELVKQLLGIVQGAARSILAKEDIELIMCERSKYGRQFTDEVSEQLKEWGVRVVKNIELMNVSDAKGSEVVENIMAKKKSQIEMESRTTVALNMRQANEAEISAEKDIKLRQQEARQEVGLRQAKVEQEIGIAQEEAKQKVQEQAKLTAEKQMEVKRVNEVNAAEIEKQANVVKAEGEKNVIEVNAEAAVAKATADKNVKILNAEASKQEVELNADAELKVATNNAKGTELKGKADAEAKKLLEVANVAGQIELAQKIGENKEYQEFLINQKKVEALAEVGKEQARNLGKADIKIFANAGNVTDGINKAAGVFSSQNGLNIGSLLEALKSTPAGEELVNGVLSKLTNSKDK